MTSNRLMKMEKAVSELGGGRCPRCHAAGQDTSAVPPRIFVDSGDGAPAPKAAERVCPECGTVAGLVRLRGLPKMDGE